MGIETIQTIPLIDTESAFPEILKEVQASGEPGKFPLSIYRDSSSEHLNLTVERSFPESLSLSETLDDSSTTQNSSHSQRKFEIKSKVAFF
jgi:hypothetical protein